MLLGTIFMEGNQMPLEWPQPGALLKPVGFFGPMKLGIGAKTLGLCRGMDSYFSTHAHG